jgi:quinol monooxygenase YgiN
MNDLNDETINLVDGSDFTDRELEIAAENNIQLEEKVSEVPMGETDEVIEEQSVDIENVEEGSEDPIQDTNVNVEDTQQGDDSQPSEQEVDALPKGFQKQLKRKERQNNRLVNELTELRAQLAKQANDDQANLGPENFTSQSEYDAHLQNQSTRQMQQQVRQEMQRQQEYETGVTQWNTKVHDAYDGDTEAIADYNDAIEAMGNPADHFDPTVNQVMFDDPNGPKMLEFFASTPGAIEQLNALPSEQVGVVLRNLSAHVAKPVASAKQVSKATPIGGVQQTSAGTNVNKPIGKMSDKEQLALYRSGKWNYGS